ncbi:uncharacterized protein LOC106638831 [Copidosoma floridanum]|uniref:uncharacterized protein LOC106638831 n=1 Tax=Copidosoma floridanum TaxID=29053 RepID=UPI0006C9B05F|nr:uncharacterized protein LOC106638831 [Copidosoma floridanum]
MLSPFDSLSAMGRHMGDNDIFIALVTSKFDFHTYKDWQKHLGSSKASARKTPINPDQRSKSNKSVVVHQTEAHSSETNTPNKHNTSMHKDEFDSHKGKPNNEKNNENPDPKNKSCLNVGIASEVNFPREPRVLLATAVVYIVDSNGSSPKSRSTNISLSGIRDQTINVKQSVQFKIQPHFESNLSLEVEALVVPWITSYKPPVCREFWSIEEPISKPTLSPQESQCEEHFSNTHSRQPDGPYMVRLPFKASADDLKAANKFWHQAALSMLKQLEQRFLRDPELYKAFNQFMTEYSALGHMRKGHELNRAQYFLSHHGVYKTNSETLKLRVVFNGSFKNREGHSLNFVLHLGPNLLHNLFEIILKWRFYSFVFTTDVEKMFRQIMVYPEDQIFQAILWRSQPSDPVKTYLLTTVTYGLVSSPYLATRVLRQLAMDSIHSHLRAAKIISEEFYVDDCLSGAHSLLKAQQKGAELLDLPQSGSFPLRKWSSNSAEVLSKIPDKFKISKPKEFKDYDQTSLWLLKVSWDQPLPPPIVSKWISWLDQLPQLNQITIPRWNFFSPDFDFFEIHGSADASKSAYAAVVYVRIVKNQGIDVTLQLAKTEVSPIKTLSIPRLELCAAQLLAKIIRHFSDCCPVKEAPVHLWTNSLNVLHWLNALPSKWPTFIANRCSNIYELVRKAEWHHIRSKQNPADIASQGIYPSQMSAQRLWFSGPDILHEFQPEYPKLKIDLLEDTSHVNILVKDKGLDTFVNGLYGPLFNLSIEELENAALLLVYTHQKRWFSADLAVLRRNQGLRTDELDKLSSSSRLHKLTPVIIDDLLRVGGRLSNSLLDANAKHPLIFYGYDCITQMLIDYYHRKALHGGVEMILVSLRQKYWILRDREVVRAELSHCFTCKRYKGRTQTQLMSDLPNCRVTPSPPFQKTGVDYAGPFPIWLSKSRGKGTLKGYVVVFICMATKAVHLEVAEDYSTEAFIAAFHRLVSRRGQCTDLYSDQGTNFVGADHELKRMWTARCHSSDFADSLLSSGTEWYFNPPAAPHFGGIWESAVKSAKFHLKRVVGDQILTFVEFSTFLCRIESCLDSRPLCPLTDDPEDLYALTPAHLLILRPSYVLPQLDLTSEKISPLHRWKLVTQTVQDFWRRWFSEYLSTLQARSKWLTPQRSMHIGDLVLIKNELTPPGKLPLGRIIEIFKDQRSLVRVVKVKTSSTVLTRPIHKLILLRTNSEIEAINSD